MSLETCDQAVAPEVSEPARNGPPAAPASPAASRAQLATLQSTLLMRRRGGHPTAAYMPAFVDCYDKQTYVSLCREVVPRFGVDHRLYVSKLYVHDGPEGVDRMSAAEFAQAIGKPNATFDELINLRNAFNRRSQMIGGYIVAFCPNLGAPAADREIYIGAVHIPYAQRKSGFDRNCQIWRAIATAVRMPLALGVSVKRSMALRLAALETIPNWPYSRKLLLATADAYLDELEKATARDQLRQDLMPPRK